MGDSKPEYNRYPLEVPLKQTYGGEQTPVVLQPGRLTLIRPDKEPRIISLCGRRRVEPKTLEDK